MSNLASNLHFALGQIAPRPGPRHVTILLATYNGAALLKPQLTSFIGQTHDDWSLLVSDDGSTDGTRTIIQEFAKAHPSRRITLIRGPERGSAQNFLSLLRAAGRAPFVAFADQDDLWLKHKLSRAVSLIGREDRPTIYGSRTIIADQNLAPQRLSLLFKRPPSFRNALVQNIAGGNTLVLNRAALERLQPASRTAKRIVAHDWWSYQMVTGMGGSMIYDATPGLLYRQHSKNQIGANDTVQAMAARMQRLVDGRFSSWLDAHFEALNGARPWLTPDAIETLEACASLRSPSLIGRIRALRQSGICRQTCKGSAALVLAAACGRL